MQINLYPEMNEKISGLLRLSDEPSQMYAAALIDSLQTENAALNEQIEQACASAREHCDKADKAKKETATLKKALEVATTERDKAVEDMNHIANKIANCKEFISGGTDKVNALKLGRCDVCSGICHDDKPCRFEWRGIQQAQEQEGKE